MTTGQFFRNIRDEITGVHIVWIFSFCGHYFVLVLRNDACSLNCSYCFSMNMGKFHKEINSIFYNFDVLCWPFLRRPELGQVQIITLIRAAVKNTNKVCVKFEFCCENIDYCWHQKIIQHFGTLKVMALKILEFLIETSGFSKLHLESFF